MDEIWKDVIGYEGLYQVSNLGRVKAFAKKGLSQDKILSCANSNGYRMIYLRKNGKRSYHSVHRLVAKAFIPNPKFDTWYNPSYPITSVSYTHLPVENWVCSTWITRCSTARARSTWKGCFPTTGISLKCSTVVSPSRYPHVLPCTSSTGVPGKMCIRDRYHSRPH